jgi:acetylglutamate kinase
MPVVAPVGVDADRQPHNVNADLAAAAVATALRAEKLVYLSDVEGVLAGETLVKSMNLARASAMIAGGVISNGMIPKVESAFRALEAGVGKVHMIDGRVRHSLLLEIFTDEGIGTELLRSPAATTPEVSR